MSQNRRTFLYSLAALTGLSGCVTEPISKPEVSTSFSPELTEIEQISEISITGMYQISRLDISIAVEFPELVTTNKLLNIRYGTEEILTTYVPKNTTSYTVSFLDRESRSGSYTLRIRDIDNDMTETVFFKIQVN